MKDVLPYCPWSIAGTMSLLVGSEVVDRKMLPVGAEFMNNKELSKCFDGHLFGLGWWDRDGQRRFGIDVAKPDEELDIKSS